MRARGLSHPSFRRTGRAAALLVLFAAIPARGARLELAELTQAPIELIAPRASAVLESGTTAELAWRPAAGFDALAGATEWEAFLSLDGGRSYPVRLTPHLDLGRRHFGFRVPDMPSDAVRLLLRIGDERAERAVRFPTPLRIVRPRSRIVASLEAVLSARPSAAPGEAALAGGAGALFWVEGDRDGRNLRQRSAVPSGARSSREPSIVPGEPESLASDGSDGAHAASPPAPSAHPAAASPPARPARRVEPLTSSDILLLIQRQNE